MRTVTALLIAVVIGGLLWLSLDSGRFAPPAERLVSLPLGGLALIFGVRAWAASRSEGGQWAPFYTGLALGVGGWALARLIVR